MQELGIALDLWQCFIRQSTYLRLSFLGSVKSSVVLGSNLGGQNSVAEQLKK
jgi:hypothetical protein